MSNDLFDSFASILISAGLEPFEDDIESQATDFALGHGLHPEVFYEGFMKYLAGL